MHAIELSFYDIKWFPFHHRLRSHCIMVIIVSNVTTIDIYPKFCERFVGDIHVQTDLSVCMYCVGQVRYYSAILEGSWVNIQLSKNNE